MKKFLTVLRTVALLGCVAAALFWLTFGPAVREARQKEAAFRSLGSAEFSRLIEAALLIKKRVGEATVLRFGGHAEPSIPSEFKRFGFDRLRLAGGVVEGRIYWLVDSGGFARIDTRVRPLRLVFVSGDNGELVEVLYEKIEPNQLLHPTAMVAGGSLRGGLASLVSLLRAYCV